MAEVQGWSRMRDMSTGLLERRTGAGVDEWVRRIRDSGADTDEKSLRAWLEEQGVTGYPQHLLVFERFGYPDYLVASPDELIDAQYSDRPQLRPIFDRIVAVATRVGEVRVQARKGYVTLVSPRRTFALIRASKKRVDLGFRLEKRPPQGRLRAAGTMPQGWARLKFELASADEVDSEVEEVLAEAYRANV
jgi:Domain of unknown function (DUF5655)